MAAVVLAQSDYNHLMNLPNIPNGSSDWGDYDNDGVNVTVDWDDMPVNTKGIVYTVYGSDDPYSGFVPVAVQLTASEWTVPISESKKFYRVTAGSSSK